jgi:hypothetical protein
VVQVAGAAEVEMGTPSVFNTLRVSLPFYVGGSVAACVCCTALCIDTASHSAQQSACMMAISLRSA